MTNKRCLVYETLGKVTNLQVSESAAPKGMMRLEGVFGVCGVKNQNNRIYDKEKTVCDVIYHRNKMGFEPAMEVLKRYVQQQDRDINQLITYAKRLQVETTIKQYLEALL